MTTHGAKGLESPIVILPETHTPKDNNNKPIVRDRLGRPIWRQNKENAPELQRDGVSLSKHKAEQERLRLLYVAMTRAESWLILCGAGEALLKPDTWFQRAMTALKALPAVPLQTEFGEGLRYETGAWPEDKLTKDAVKSSDHILDDWVYEIAKTPHRPAKLLKPSEMPGSKTVPGHEENVHALAFGSAVHVLLEVTGWIKHSDPNAAALDLLDQRAIELPDPERLDAISQAQAVLNDKDLSWLFDGSALAEVGVTAPVEFEGHDRMYGVIDRLVVEPDRVTIVDFKTNAVVPKTPHLVPDGILGQLAVYADAVSRIYPNRKIETAILWTATGQIMPIPHNIVMAAGPVTAAS